MLDASNSSTSQIYPVLASIVAMDVRPIQGIYLDLQDNLILARKPSPQDEVVAVFKKYERKWKRETRHLSSPTEKYLHPSYARIIGLGWPAVALILKSLSKERGDWFYALRALTGTSPVTSSMAGNMKQMTAAWLRWGSRMGLL